MTANPPPSLKKIKVFLARAAELDRDAGNPESRVAAYNCRQYAVLTGIPLAGTDAAAKEFLGTLLGTLEKEKRAMAVFSRDEHWQICRKVADRAFGHADGEDRAGTAGKGTAKGFYAAGTFYEVLQQFHNGEGENDEAQARREEEEQRRLYCKWKATDILNAIKEGRTPTPGGYQQEQSQEDEEPSGGLAPIAEGPPSSGGGPPPAPAEELPPAPSVPFGDFAGYGGGGAAEAEPEAERGASVVEVGMDGTPTVEDADSEDDEDIHIPGKKAGNATSGSDIFVDAIAPVEPPPPPSYDAMPAVPPPAASRPLPLPPPAPAPAPSSGMFSSVASSLFGGGGGAAELSKPQLADAVELTKFALSALEQGDGTLGRERLEQALGLWKSKKHAMFGKSSRSPGKERAAAGGRMTEGARLALAALQKGDCKSARDGLEQALGVSTTGAPRRF